MLKAFFKLTESVFFDALSIPYWADQVVMSLRKIIPEADDVVLDMRDTIKAELARGVVYGLTSHIKKLSSECQRIINEKTGVEAEDITILVDAVIALSQGRFGDFRATIEKWKEEVRKRFGTIEPFLELLKRISSSQVELFHITAQLCKTWDLIATGFILGRR